MKKALAMLLSVALLFTVLPMSAWAFESSTVYKATDGCRLTELQFTQEKNAWLLWDVTFTSSNEGRVLSTEKDHPNLIGRKVIPTFTYEGSQVTFNGTEIVSGVTSVTLKEINELVVYGNDTKAEYAVYVTEETSGLPVVLIDTDDAAITNKVDYVSASISILGGDVDYASDLYSVAAGIRLRGNSTMGYDKKPYRIKFSKKQSVLDMGKAKNWTLIANYLDPAFIRNELSYNLASRLNAMTGANREDGFVVFVPRMRPVEVYLNGEYVGLYDLCDHIQANEIRVNIDEDEDENGNVMGSLDTGYFIEVEAGSRVLSEYESEGTPYFTVKAGGVSTDELYFQFKLPDSPTDEQIQYIQSYVQNISDLLLAKDSSVWEYLDMDSVIDWYLANELFKNTDSALLSSCYFFKDKGGVLKMGPVWDFDLSAGAVSYGGMSDPTGWRTRSSENAAWFESMFEMQEFSDAVNERWAAMHKSGILDDLFTDIDTLAARIDTAAQKNYTTWYDSYVSAVNSTSWLTVPSTLLSSPYWEQQLQYVRSFMLARINWMDGEFGYTEGDEDEDTAYVSLVSDESASGTTTIAVNRSFNVKKLSKLYLSVTATTSFDITFNFDIGSPSLSTDWTGLDATLYPFVNRTGSAVSRGTYTDVALDLTGYMPYSSDPDAEVITLKSITITPQNNRGLVRVSSLYAAATPQESVSAADSVLGGTPTIWGVAEYGQTLTADTQGVTPYQTTVTYQWNRNGTPISGATGSTYSITTDDIGSSISLTVTNQAGTSSLTTEAVTVEKRRNTYRTTQIPVLASKTSDSITITGRTGYEYRIDGGDWQTDTTFTGLDSNTCYRIYYRHAETDTAQGGVQGDPLYVVTDPAAVIVKGDVNGDDSINTSDAKMILSYTMGRSTLTSDQFKAADLNDDGRADTSDVRLLLAQIVATV